MKKLGLLALLLSVSVASVGCEPPKKKEADKKPAATEPAAAPAGDAKPAEPPAAPIAPAEPAAK